MKKKIAVIFGGVSSEYEISLQSATAVLRHLNQEELELYPIGISQEGEWFYYTGDFSQIEENRWQQDKAHCFPSMIVPDRKIHGMIVKDGLKTETISLDLVFPVLHGKNGEDGTIQGLIELAGIPLVGCGTMSSALCMDKYRAHEVVANHGILVARSFVIHPSMPQERIQKKLSFLRFPLFVKPLKAGSSFGITKVSAPDELRSAISNAFMHDDEVIVEENIEGFEVGCAIMGTHESLTIGEVDEIELKDGFFDFKEKYTLVTSSIHVPARVSEQERKRIKEAAGIIYNALGCKGFARVDLFYTPDHEIVFNEVNTIPGFTSHSRFPTMMKEAGISFEVLLNQLVQEAIA